VGTLTSEANVELNHITVVGIQCVVPASGAAAPAVTPILASTIGLATTATIGTPPLDQGALQVVNQIQVSADLSGSQLTGMTAAVTSSVKNLQSQQINQGGGVSLPVYAPSASTGDGISVQVDGQLISGRDPLPIYGGQYLALNISVPRGGMGQPGKGGPVLGEHSIEILGYDNQLSPDLLFQYTVSAEAEFVNRPIAQARPDVGAAYVVYLTATKNNSVTDILSASRLR
jgi:hypothetical protein